MTALPSLAGTMSERRRAKTGGYATTASVAISMDKYWYLTAFHRYLFETPTRDFASLNWPPLILS